MSIKFMEKQVLKLKLCNKNEHEWIFFPASRHLLWLTIDGKSLLFFFSIFSTSGMVKTRSKPANEPTNEPAQTQTSTRKCQTSDANEV